MNTGPAHTRSSHLDLTELIAGAAGRPAGDDARAHLTSCGECRAEASRWNIVADGVRSLAADAAKTGQPAPVQPLQERRPTRRGVPPHR
jgi:anti-sigma factor RsiW